jgi:hypothetical protein
MTSSTSANLTVPASCVYVNDPYGVTITMTNWGGSSTVTLGRSYVPPATAEPTLAPGAPTASLQPAR